MILTGRPSQAALSCFLLLSLVLAVAFLMQLGFDFGLLALVSLSCHPLREFSFRARIGELYLGR